MRLSADPSVPATEVARWDVRAANVQVDATHKIVTLSGVPAGTFNAAQRYSISVSGTALRNPKSGIIFPGTTGSDATGNARAITFTTHSATSSAGPSTACSGC